jgi:hypothetical protein
MGEPLRRLRTADCMFASPTSGLILSFAQLLLTLLGLLFVLPADTHLTMQWKSV